MDDDPLAPAKGILNGLLFTIGLIAVLYLIFMGLRWLLV